MMKKILIATLVVIFCSTPLMAKKSVMSLKQTVELRAVSSNHISPDGKLIAYTLTVPRETYKAEDGKAYSELFVTNSNADNRRFITGKVNVESISWSNDSQYIYYIAKRNDDKFKGVYRISANGGESEKVVSIKSDVKGYSVNSHNNQLVFIAEPAKDRSVDKLKKKGFMAKVYEESKKNKNAYLVDLLKKENKPQKMALSNNILSVSFSPTNSNQILMRVAPTALIDDDYTASKYEVYSTKGKLLSGFETEGKLGMAQWSDDGKHVAMIGAENENDPAAGRLFIGNVDTGKVNKPLKNYQGHVKAFEWLSGSELAFLGHVGTKSEVSVYNLNNQTIANKMQPSENIIRSINSDSSGQKLIAMASSSQHPGEVFDLSNGSAKRLTNSNIWLKDIKMPKQKSITYKARDGVELEGVLVYPIGYKKNKRYPMIMMVHGGPESHISNEWLDKYSYPIKHAAGNGFAVFLPNYRGSTGRGVEFSKMGQADYAGAEFNDLVDAITHLSDIGLVDKKRVGITGGSYGGYASAWAATALSEHFAASVMFVGISNQLSKFGTTDIPKEMYNVHARNYPWDKWQWMLERSPIYHTDKAKTPILIMHGENDTRVHPSQSMELYRYIKTRTKTPARLVFYPGEPHGNKNAGAQLDYSMRLMRWMNFYLKGKNKADKIPPYELDHKSRLESSKES